MNQMSLLPVPDETAATSKPEDQFTIEQIVSADYWIDFLSKVTNWFVTVFPSLILLVVFLVVSLRLLKFFLNRLSRFTIRKAKKLEDKDELKLKNG
jgi:hypothetical protein